jgi:hypothetical protein
MVRRVAPRFFGKLSPQGRGRRLRLAQNDKEKIKWKGIKNYFDLQ